MRMADAHSPKCVLTHTGQAAGQVCDGTRSGSYEVTPDPHRRGRGLSPDRPTNRCEGTRPTDNRVRPTGRTAPSNPRRPTITPRGWGDARPRRRVLRGVLRSAATGVEHAAARARER